MAVKEPSDKEKRHNLGRGLASLFGDAGPPGEAPGTPEGQPRGRREVPLELIHPNKAQPRRRFDAEPLQQLAQSIHENGLLQPILVRPHPARADAYEIVAGERRWRAAQMARLHEVPVILRDLTDLKTLEIALLENIQREDLTPLEEAEGYRRLMEEFSYTQEALAKTLGKSRSHIANYLRLLTLPEELRDMLQAGEISAGHGRALVGASEAATLARRVVAEGLSVREIERLVQGAKARAEGRAERGDKGTAAGQGPAPAAKDADTLALERDLSAKLGLAVEIRHDGERESGELRLKYASLEQLDDLLLRLNRGPDFQTRKVIIK